MGYRVIHLFKSKSDMSMPIGRTQENILYNTVSLSVFSLFLPKSINLGLMHTNIHGPYSFTCPQKSHSTYL